MKELLKTAGGVAVALTAGAVLSRIEPFRSAELLWWPASSVLQFAAFSGSAILVGIQGEKLGRGFLIAENRGLTGIIKALLVAGVSALSYGAVGQVIAPELAGAVNGGFAALMVGVSGYTVWKVYDGFEDVAALVKGGLIRSLTGGHQAMHTPVPLDTGVSGITGMTTGAVQAPGLIQPLTLSPRDEDGEVQCSHCGNYIPAHYTFCGVCGSRIMPGDRMAARRG